VFRDHVHGHGLCRHPLTDLERRGEAADAGADHKHFHSVMKKVSMERRSKAKKILRNPPMTSDAQFACCFFFSFSGFLFFAVHYSAHSIAGCVITPARPQSVTLQHAIPSIPTKQISRKAKVSSFFFFAFLSP
jgi:hypothetical protein